MTFPPLDNSDHIVVSVSIDFSSISKQYVYSRADWDGFHDHLRFVPREDLFKLIASACC